MPEKSFELGMSWLHKLTNVYQIKQLTVALKMDEETKNKKREVRDIKLLVIWESSGVYIV